MRKNNDQNNVSNCQQLPTLITIMQVDLQDLHGNTENVVDPQSIRDLNR